MNFSINNPSNTLKTAVLFLVFNRPDTTREVFEAIRQAKPPRLYVASDGPRLDVEGEFEKVTLVRKIATRVDWPCEVFTLFQDKNIGCQFGPRAGIDWFFANEPHGIILEDDCLPNQSFFCFCEEMLDRYKNCEKIMAITGTNIAKNLKFNADYFFSIYPTMWGWASWKRAWVKYDPSLTDWNLLKKNGWLSNFGVGGLPFVKRWTAIFDLTDKLGAKATWWDYQWIYSCWRNNGLVVAPKVNLIKNIGLRWDATHNTTYDPILSNLVPVEFEWPIKIPKVIKHCREADMYIGRHWFKVSWSEYGKSILRQVPGFIFFNALRKKVISFFN